MDIIKVTNTKHTFGEAAWYYGLEVKLDGKTYRLFLTEDEFGDATERAAKQPELVTELDLRQAELKPKYWWQIWR